LYFFHFESEHTMSLFGSIGKIFNKVADFAKKAVSFGNSLLNGPLGQFASLIPGVGQYVQAAKKALAIADGFLNGDGAKDIAQNLANKKDSPLSQPGSLLSTQGIGTVAGLFGQTQNSDQISDLVEGFTGTRRNESTPAAKGDCFNIEQLAASQLARVFNSSPATA
jgi:hypothetical protein